MYESGHSPTADADELRRALASLEDALALQQLRLDAAVPRGDPADAAMRGIVVIMQREAERLRQMLAGSQEPTGS